MFNSLRAIAQVIRPGPLLMKAWILGPQLWYFDKPVAWEWALVAGLIKADEDSPTANIHSHKHMYT